MKPGDPVIGTPVGPMKNDFPTVTGTYWAKEVESMGETWVSDGIYVADKDYVVECDDIKPVHPRRNKS